MFHSVHCRGRARCDRGECNACAVCRGQREVCRVQVHRVAVGVDADQLRGAKVQDQIAGPGLRHQVNRRVVGDGDNSLAIGVQEGERAADELDRDVVGG